MKFKPMPIIRYYIRWVVLLILFGTLAMCIIPFKVSYQEMGLAYYFFIVLFFSMPCLWIYILHKELWEKIFATVYISSEEIVWACPFRKTRRIKSSMCYIGVELEDSYIKADYPYIYFSTFPYPKEMEHKIDKMPCTNNFIKYRFHLDIAEYVLTILPKEQTKRLDYFCYMYKK